MEKEIKLLIMVGARPNFIKVAPLINEIRDCQRMKYILVHTGQHYDFEMSQIFFNGLNIPKPDYNLEVCSGSHCYQTGRALIKLERILLKEKPNLLIVVGDANACLIGALTAAKIRIPIAHIEAGLRSFDMSMPEEVNRRLTDHISDYLFITEPSASKNLLKEGIDKNKIFPVGNIMIDSLKKSEDKIKNLTILKDLNLRKKEYSVLTLHRPENVDNKIIFEGILRAIEKIQNNIKIVWPIHPRAEKQIKNFGLNEIINKTHNLIVIQPLGYLEMLALNKQAKFILTDSGGIQEEATFLKVPCLTIRKNTERPITVMVGTNIVTGRKKEKVVKEANKILSGKEKIGRIPKLWDGKTTKRIIKIIYQSQLT